MNIFSKRQQEYVTSIDAWMDEKSSYDFPSMQCQEGKLCGHYRQVMISQRICIAPSSLCSKAFEPGFEGALGEKV